MTVRQGLGLALLALAMVLVIGQAQGAGWLSDIDGALMHWAGALRDSPGGRAVTPLMIGLTRLGDTVSRILMLALVAGLLAVRGRYRDIGWIVLLTLAITALNGGLKLIFGAARPDLLPHLDQVHSFSFPSGHASGNMAFWLGLAVLAGGWAAWAAAAGIAVLIGLSRLWLGVHWPSDIIAGWIEAAGMLFCLAPLRRATRAGEEGSLP